MASVTAFHILHKLYFSRLGCIVLLQCNFMPFYQFRKTVSHSHSLYLIFLDFIGKVLTSLPAIYSDCLNAI